MKLIVGYDKDFSAQFFRRTLRTLVETNGKLKTAVAIDDEINYLSARFSETLVYGYDTRFGSPWAFGHVSKLAKASPYSASRVDLAKAELAANNILIFLGLVARGGVGKEPTEEREKWMQRWLSIAEGLYRLSSMSRFQGYEGKVVLGHLARHTSDWVELLRVLPGTDLLELLGMRETFLASP